MRGHQIAGVGAEIPIKEIRIVTLVRSGDRIVVHLEEETVVAEADMMM